MCSVHYVGTLWRFPPENASINKLTLVCESRGPVFCSLVWLPSYYSATFLLISYNLTLRSFGLPELFFLSLFLSPSPSPSFPPPSLRPLSRCCLPWSPDRYVRCSYHRSPCTQPQAGRERSRWDLQWRGRGISNHYREIVNIL